MPAAMATPLPLASDVTFSLISAFASSISSRTSSEAFVETSLTVSPSDFSAVLPFSVIGASELSEQLREDEATHERGDHRDLGMRARLGRLVGVPGRLAGAIARRCRAGVFAGFHHSGGSSSKTLT